MGYGGVFKSVVRIAIPAIVALAGGGPIAIAISSAAATGATGGSFKESLMSGVTSYIGANIGQSINAASQAGTIGSAINSGAATVSPALTGGGQLVFQGGNLVASGAAATAAIDAASAAAAGSFSLANTLSGANEAITGGLSTFTTPGINQGFGGIVTAGKELFKTPFDILQQVGDTVLGQGAIAATTNIPLSPLGSFIGGATTLTLNQALLADTPEADELLANEGFTPQQIQLLKQEARNALSQQAFEGLQETVVNPGLLEDEFNKILAAGIERENVRLGPDITEAQFRAVFDDPGLGQNILGEEESLRKQAYNQAIGGAFPGGAFDPIDDDIINAILDERIEPVQRQVATAGARGNLNLYGGRTANEELSRQRGVGFENVSQIGEGLQQGSQSEIDFIKDRASADVRGYQLGDELFDVAPFSQERSDLIGAKEGSLGADLSSAVGDQSIFDVQKALNIGGRAQGPVSGPVNQSFLDAIARGGGGPAAAKTRRGLGQSGRGVF